MGSWSWGGTPQGWASQGGESSLASAQRAMSMLSAGGGPTPVQVPIHLRPGEQCYGYVPVQLLQFLEGDPTYSQTWAFGTGCLGIGLFAGSLVGNQVAKQRAQARAAPMFRPIDAGTLYITTERFAVQGQRWTDLWFDYIRTAHFDDESIVLYVADAPAVQLRMPSAGYHYIIYRWLSEGEIPSESGPSSLPSPGQRPEEDGPPGTVFS